MITNVYYLNIKNSITTVHFFIPGSGADEYTAGGREGILDPGRPGDSIGWFHTHTDHLSRWKNDSLPWIKLYLETERLKITGFVY